MSTTSVETNTTTENEIKVRSMKEICFIVAFCDKFKPYLKGIEFWPEELERAIATECENDLIENLHCTFLNNCLNRKKPIERTQWQKFLSEAIDQKIKKGYHFYQDFNPLRRVKNYYELNVEDKVLILNKLITWQLQDSLTIRKMIDSEYRNGKKNEENSLEVKPYGVDRRGRRYYYFGYGARIYRETITKGKGKNKQTKITWEAITTTVEDVENYINNPKEIKPTAKLDKVLYKRLVDELLPEIKKEIQLKEKRDARKVRQEKLAQRVALLHANSEIVASRTRSGTRRAARVNYAESSASSGTSISRQGSFILQDEATPTTGHYATRSRTARGTEKRNYEEVTQDHDSDARSSSSTKSSKKSKISADLSSVSNGARMSRTTSVVSVGSAATANSIFSRADYESPEFREVFGSEAGTDLSDPGSDAMDEDL
ncbi:5784_t:CDS:2 [Funneliformis mosseae]|uniref:5784_t:CDS:1 n=1 Tax=Funneliformis mosseae TaxID=27381 RepID=A0A9N8WCK3_FUNMO|nr:5784_t:CDS:2 [Funneliformis mosseae]